MANDWYNVSLPAAQRQSFNPWNIPDDFSVYDMAPDHVKPLLHPHWKTQKAVHPIYAYFFGIYYLTMGNFKNLVTKLPKLQDFKSN